MAAGVDDKVLRRRLQYKFHQRRHRAKQKEKTLALEREVSALSADVDALQRRRAALLSGDHGETSLDLTVSLAPSPSNSLFASRAGCGGEPARIVVEFFRQYEFGWSALREQEQQRFLRAVMTEQTRGPDYTGVEFVLDQWRRFGVFFASMRFVTSAPQVTNAGDMTVVTIDADVHMRPHRSGLVAICPGVQGNEAAVQTLVGRMLHVPTRYQFLIDASGKVAFFGADMNFLGAIQEAVGSLAITAELFTDLQISSSTGQIYASPTSSSSSPPPPSAAADPRLQVDFLLT